MRKPHSVAPNIHAERSSPQSAGHLNISNYTILNTFKLHAWGIWLFPARPDALNPLSPANWSWTMIQSKTWTGIPTSNMLKTLQTTNLNHYDLLCQWVKPTPVPVNHWAITLLIHGNATLRVAMRRTYKTIHANHSWRVKSPDVSRVGSRRGASRWTMTTCWRKKTPLCVSEGSNTVKASWRKWIVCQMIRPLRSRNYTLSRICDGKTIT